MNISGLEKHKYFNTFLLFSTFILTIVTFYLRFGYHFGVNDQWVLSPKGISMADPTAFVGDWFTHGAPQPHWLFDFFTALGEKIGYLPEFYLLYWLATAFAMATFFTWIFLWIKKPLLALAGPPLLALGPHSLLGSGITLWGWALPHSLGGSLAVLALVAWMTGRYRWCSFLLLFSTLIHVQHGAHSAGLILVAALVFRSFKKVGWSVVGSLVIVFSIAKVLGLAGGGDVFLTACQKYIPYHCLATSWPFENFFPVLFLTSGFGISFLGYKKHFAPFYFIAGLIIFGLYLGIALDVLNIESISWIPRRFNIYRLVSLLVPFSIVGFLWGTCLAFEAMKRSTIKNVFILIVSFSGLLTWIMSRNAGLEGQLVVSFFWTSLILILIFLSTLELQRFNFLKLLGLICISTSLFFAEHFYRSAPYDNLKRIGQFVQEAVPPGKLILISPHFEWFRFMSRRAIIADTKAIPYQPDTFAEWENRIHDLGGFDNSGRSYSQLDYSSWSSIARKYKADYAFVTEGDAVAQEVSQKHKLVLKLEGQPSFYVYKLEPNP